MILTFLYSAGILTLAVFGFYELLGAFAALFGEDDA